MSNQNLALPEIDPLWDYNQPEESERRFREIEPAARESGDASYLAQLLSQIARAQGLQRQFDMAHRTLNQVENMTVAGAGVARIRLLLERGRAFNSSGQASDAAPLFLAAWELATQLAEDFYAIDAAHMLGICAEPAEQLQWNIQALAAAEASEQPLARNWRGSLYNNIGWTNYDMGRFETALDYFKRGLAWRTQQGQPRERRIAAYCVGKSLRALGRLHGALALQRDVQAELGADGQQDGYVEEELGECLLALGMRSEAVGHFARAHALLRDDFWLAEHQAERLVRMKRLGQAEVTETINAAARFEGHAHG